MLRNFHPPPTIYIPLSPSVSCSWIYLPALSLLLLCYAVHSICLWKPKQFFFFALVLFSCRTNPTVFMFFSICRRLLSFSLSFPRRYKCNSPPPWKTKRQGGVESNILDFTWSPACRAWDFVAIPSKGMGTCLDNAAFHWRVNSSERHLIRNKSLGKVVLGLYISFFSVPAGSRHQNTYNSYLLSFIYTVIYVYIHTL